MKKYLKDQSTKYIANKIDNTKTAKKITSLRDKYHNAKKNLKRAKLTSKVLIKIGAFLVSNPIGWAILAALIVFLPSLDDNSNSKNTSNKHKLSDENNKQLVLLLSNNCNQTSKAGASTENNTNSGNASEADWTKEGTVAYKNAKRVFDSWVNLGLSGHAAAGIVGWVNSEGNFAMVGRAEGHYGNDLENNSIKYGVVPKPSTNKYTVGGGGIYQFTPYTKYAELGSDDWEDIDKMNRAVVKFIAGGDWNPSHDLTGGNHSFSDMAQSTNEEEAALMWNAYERGDVAVIPKDKKRADAKKAAELFKASDHPFDAAKFESVFGKAAKGENIDIESKPKGACGDYNGGQGWSKDKTGHTDLPHGIAFKPDDVPSELKQYALDPRSLGIGWKSTDGWQNPSGLYDQCTDLSATLMHHLWRKNGEKPVQLLGNGIDVAENWAKAFGGSTTNNPTSGAVYSEPGNDPVHGHTGVVSHVFEDGKLLVIEQNVAGYSGHAISQPNTWSYKIIGADKYSHWKFYDPSANGFEINNEAKAIA